VSGGQTDDRVLRAATRRLAVLTAASITVVLLVVGAVVVAVVVQEQDGEGRAALRQAVVDLDDADGAPATIGVWLRAADGSTQRSHKAPRWLPVRSAVAAVSAAAPRDERVVHHHGTGYQLLTVRRSGLVIHAAASTAPQVDERNRLLTGLGVAELAGLGLSVLIGTWLARRAMTPLATAMTRQRRFIADASHELRTPLTLLSTRAQLLERALRRSAPGDAHAESEELVADTHRLAGVVDDLLLSASLADQPGRSEPVDLVAVARAAVASAAPHGAEQGITIEGPSSAAVGAIVNGAPGPLRRVLDSLLDNAVTHTLPGGHVVVRVDAGPPATVAVIDDGTGIDPDVLPHLFDRFAHGGATPGARRHFGLGLALVREIVTAHRGTVGATATPGGGTTFTVTLPGQDAQ
jgi:signal transduction histidine kinase